jgi:beta-glucanase (GH16 family)
MERYKTILVFLIAIPFALAKPIAAAPPEGYTLAWSDDFNGSKLDTTKWSHRGLGKRRHAVNVADAVTVQNGMLRITTYTTNGRHHTGMIGTQGKFESNFGYYEARIRFEDSPGMWSAFWIQTPTMGQPIGDPAKAGMEIDILEHRVSNKAGKNITGSVQHAIHWDGYGSEHQSRSQHTKDLDLNQGFHVFGFEWTPQEYRFFVDGNLTWSCTPVSKRPQYIILSSEVQDNGWAGKIPSKGYGSKKSSRTNMQVDYVRYYKPRQ